MALYCKADKFINIRATKFFEYLLMVKESWEELSSDLIRKSFSCCGVFVETAQDELEDEDDYLINTDEAYIDEVTIINNIDRELYKEVKGYKNN
ncbi:28175_t:CDS:2 [Racocetra persica]|uniref:28175_t:CDS:1 n=1 Tax=Racocetra persica TaxID=160502 RepID=A0ACA9L350_9GLOM|nr:28175_t:CDS:2 [Racocetra persica]